MAQEHIQSAVLKQLLYVSLFMKFWEIVLRKKQKHILILFK